MCDVEQQAPSVWSPRIQVRMLICRPDTLFSLALVRPFELNMKLAIGVENPRDSQSVRRPELRFALRSGERGQEAASKIVDPDVSAPGITDVDEQPLPVW